MNAYMRGAVVPEAQVFLPSRPRQRSAPSALELLVCDTMCGPASLCCFTQVLCRHAQGFKAKVDAWSWSAEEHSTQSQAPEFAYEAASHAGPQQQQAGQWQPVGGELAQLLSDAGPETQWPQGEAWSSDGGQLQQLAS